MTSFSANTIRKQCYRQWFSQISLYVTIVAAPMLFGTVHLLIQLLLISLCFITFILFIGECVFVGRKIELPAVSIIFFLYNLYLLWQLVPLPAGMIEFLNPKAAELLDHTLKPLGLYRVDNYRPLSLSPPGTVLELFKGLAYLVIFLVVTNLAKKVLLKKRIILVMIITACVIALSGIFRYLFGVEEIFGVKSLNHGFIFSSFVNENHLAGYLGLLIFLTLGFRMVIENQNHSKLLLFVVFFLILSVFLSLSRSGVIAILLGIWLFVLWIKPWQDECFSMVNRIIAMAVSLFVIISIWVVYDQLIQDFSRTAGQWHLVKGKVWLWTIDIIKDFWLFGVGRGAFIDIMPHYLTEGGAAETVTHPENLILQVVSECGIITSIFFCLLFLFFLYQNFKERKITPLQKGAWCGLLFLGIQNLGDFNLEFMGTGLLAIVSLSLVFNRSPAWSKRIKIPIFLLLATTLLTISAIGLPWVWNNSLETMFKTANRFDQKLDPRILKTISSSINLHSNNYYLYYRTGEYLAKVGKKKYPLALKWLNISIYLNPTYWPALNLTGHLLFELDKPLNAASAWRLLLNYNPRSTPKILNVYATKYNSFEDLVKLIPPQNKEAIAYFVEYALKNNRPSFCQKTISMMQNNVEKEFQPDSILWRLRLNLQCLKEKKTKVANLLEKLMDTDYQNPDDYVRIIRTLHSFHLMPVAMEILKKSLTIFPYNLHLHLEKVHNMLIKAKPDIALKLLNDIENTAFYHNNQHDLNQIYYLKASAYRQKKQPLKVIQEYEKILISEPYNISLKINIARLYIKLKQLFLAQNIYIEILQIDPNNKNIQEELKKVEDKIKKREKDAKWRYLLER